MIWLRRVWVGEVRRVGRRYGIGRIHVERVKGGGEDALVAYLGKYLRKQFRDREAVTVVIIIQHQGKMVLLIKAAEVVVVEELQGV